MALNSPAKKTLTPEEKSAAASAMGSIMTPKKLAALRRTSPINGQLGGREPKPLGEIPCTCKAGNDTLEGHKKYCLRGAAIDRRIKRGLKVEF